MADQRLVALEKYIKEEGGRFVSELQEMVRQNSDSTTGEGIRACAELLLGRVQAVGLRGRLLETPSNPLIYADWEPRADLPTLLITCHYDVQPVEPLSAWLHDPFGAELEGDRIWGRGTSDDKGPITAVLKAIEGILRTSGPPEVNLKLLFDGEEETGSPGMPEAIGKYRELLKADAVVSFDGNSAADGRAQVKFGSGGLLYIDMEAETGRGDIHANRGALVPNAAWRLVWALASLKSADEQILIDGFDDNLVAISDEDRELLRGNEQWNDDEELRALGTKHFLPGRNGNRALEALHLMPIVGISGIHSGAGGDGVAATLPARARAKLYIGVRYAQDPDELFQKIRAHLDRRGFDDIKLTKMSGTQPSSCRVNSPIGMIVRREITTLLGRAPLLTPRSFGYGRQAPWLANQLGADGLIINLIAPPQPNNHGPNEYILLDYFFRGIQFVGRLILAAEELPKQHTT